VKPGSVAPTVHAANENPTANHPRRHCIAGDHVTRGRTEAKPARVARSRARHPVRAHAARACACGILRLVPEPTEVRIDKWLWAARMFKTRSLASEACGAGHVKLDGVSVKPAKPVRVGDRLEVRTPGGLRILEVAGIGERRGPAAVARTLYVDHTPPPPPKHEISTLLVETATRDRGAGRPSKRDLRDLRRLRGF
jgi:ribosome-associated heat shock protein Hsp15